MGAIKKTLLFSKKPRGSTTFAEVMWGIKKVRFNLLQHPQYLCEPRGHLKSKATSVGGGPTQENTKKKFCNASR